MTDAEPGENGHRTATPRIPLWIAIGSTVIALASLSVLILLLYRETRGPGEILRRFATAVDEGDCPASYDLLDQSVQAQLTEEEFCAQMFPSLDASLDADFTVERAVLQEDVATVEISGVGLTEWQLRRYGERSWRVIGPEPGFPTVMIGLGGADNP